MDDKLFAISLLVRFLRRFLCLFSAIFHQFLLFFRCFLLVFERIFIVFPPKFVVFSSEFISFPSKNIRFPSKNIRFPSEIIVFSSDFEQKRDKNNLFRHYLISLMNARRRLCCSVWKYSHCACTFPFSSSSGLLSAYSKPNCW